MHQDTKTGAHSLIILNGPPLANDNDYVHMAVRVDKLPEEAQVAVMDDPDTDSFVVFRQERATEVNWSWKRPYSDGIAISMPMKEFCIDVTVLNNTYPSEWKFYSRQSIIEGVSVDCEL